MRAKLGSRVDHDYVNRQVVHTLDKLNRLIEASAGEDIGVEWSHDLAGQRESAALANGVESEFGYDLNGRLNAVTHRGLIGGDPADLFKVQYGYDAVGNRTFTRNLLAGQADRGERYGYDNLNRLTIMDRGELNQDGTAVTTPLNHPSLASSQEWADLDHRGNWPLTRRKRLSFAAAPRHGGRAAPRVKGGLDYRWARTVDGESSNYRQTRGVTPTNEYWAVRLPDLDPALVALMQYDDAGNLTSDPLAVNAGDPGGPGQACGVGILSGVDPGSAGLPACPTGQEYVYDVENRLTEVKRHTDGATLARYEYDALGRRIHTTEYVDATSGDMLTTPKKTRHVYVGLETIEEYECTVQPPCEAEDWNLAREFLWALDAWTTALQPSASAEAGPLGLMRQGWGDTSRFPEPLAMITHGGESGGQGGTGVPAGESAYHYLHDVLGSVIGLTDESGTIVERYTYDPYGKPLIEKRDLSTNDWQLTTASAFGNPWLWTGQRYDAGVGLYAFLFRTYSPALGRWLQRDPIGYAAGSINLYEYVFGNPLVWIDPLGLEVIWNQGTCNDDDFKKLRDAYNCAKSRTKPDGTKGEGVQDIEYLEGPQSGKTVTVTCSRDCNKGTNGTKPTNQRSAGMEGVGSGSNVTISPNCSNSVLPDGGYDTESALVHELHHAKKNAEGKNKMYGEKFGKLGKKEEEQEAGKVENEHRRDKGITQRKVYGEGEEAWPLEQFPPPPPPQWLKSWVDRWLGS